jgi:hypothetical protein
VKKAINLFNIFAYQNNSLGEEKIWIFSDSFIDYYVNLRNQVTTESLAEKVERNTHLAMILTMTKLPLTLSLCQHPMSHYQKSLPWSPHINLFLILILKNLFSQKCPT